MGDTVAHPVTCTLDLSGCPAGAVVRTIANGRCWRSAGGYRQQSGMADEPAEAEWMVVEIRDRTAGCWQSPILSFSLHPIRQENEMKKRESAADVFMQQNVVQQREEAKAYDSRISWPWNRRNSSLKKQRAK